MVAALGAFGVMALQDAQRAMVKVVCMVRSPSRR